MQTVYLPDAQWLVSRSKDEKGRVWEWAAKGGHNGEHHNHNDVGSYLLNVEGKRLIVEIGAPEYTKAFFSAKRYENIAARSLGHSVPLVKGMEQGAGKEFCGRVTEERVTEEEVFFGVDFTKAYPAEAGLAQGERRMVLEKKAGVLRVVDTFELSGEGEVESAVMTQMEPVAAGRGVVVGVKGAGVRIEPEEGTEIREVQRHGYKDHMGKETAVWRVVLVGKGAKVRVGYEVRAC